MENNKPTLEQIIKLKKASCTGKKAYSDKNWAKRAAKSMKKNYGDTVKPYRCFFCNEWHLGHRTVRQVTMLNFNPWESIN